MEPWTMARAAVGPLLIGVGSWCALGHISVLTPDDPVVRLAVPAAWYWLPLAMAIAALVPGWRRRPLTATPALLATLPWWPVSVPAIALLWSGHMAWLAVLLSAAAALLSSDERTDVSPTVWRPLTSAVVAGGLTVGIAAFACWSLAPRLPGGDEPHYLIITQSLIKDGDLQIENNHLARDFAEYFAGDARPDFKIRGKNGAIYSIHAPGTAVIVLPAFAALGYRGAQATIVLLAAVASALMWYAAWLATNDRRAAWVAWLAVAATPTFIIQSVTIFPDSIGMTITAAMLVILLRLGGAGTPVGTGVLVGGSALLAILPWLHTRFSILAAGLGLIAAWMLTVDASRPAGARRRRLVLFFAVPVLSAVAWFGFFQLIYGTPNPVFPYGDDRGTRLAYVPGGLLGLFFDAQFGLFAYSPVLAAAVVGLVVRQGDRRTRHVAGAVAAVALAYLAGSASYWMWWAGVPAPPARFAAAVLPAFAVPVAWAWTASARVLRLVWLTLLTVSIALSTVVIGAARARIAWNSRGVRANWLDWLNGVSDLSRGWPSFFWRLSPADLATELHFAAHAAIWTVVFAGTCVLLVRVVRPKALASPAVAWWLAAALTLSVQAGWWFNGVNGLNAAPSQIAVLNASVDGERVLQIRPGAIGPLRDLTGRLRIRATRADEVGQPDASWLPMLELPPGEFALSVALRRPRPGALDLRIGRSREPLRRLALSGVSEQTIAVSLPAGAGALFFEPDAGLAASGDRLELTPTALGGHSAGERAAASAGYGPFDVFFADTTPYVEPDGFWIRGGRTTAFAIAAGRDRTNVTLEIENGLAANDVTVAWNGREERLAFGPGQTRRVRLDFPRGGTAAVRLTSRAGFRPADDGTSEDRRYLGVRARLLE
jgi:hypothetical protein